MDRTSKHGLDLIGIAASKLKGVWAKAFLGALMYVSPIILLAFIPYCGWALSFAVFGWLTAGYIQFMKQLLRGENPKYTVIFTTVHEFAQATLIGVIMCTGTLLGTVLFIVPGMLMIVFYSLSLYVLNENAITSVADTFNLTARKMHGNKTAMVAYKVVYYLFYLLAGLIALVAFLFIAKLYATNQALAIVLGIIDVVVAIVLIAIVTVYFYASNDVFYAEIVRQQQVEYNVIKPVEGADLAELNVVPEAEVKAEVVEAAPVEEAKEEVKAEKAPAKKPAAKKPAAKKAPATKAATTTKTTTKTAATKTTAKKTTTKKTTDK